jgi:glycosyltransferase involved in cell wall biosynthesis
VRIAAISVAPIFPNYVIGGSQKILTDVTAGLKNLNHDVQIWCTGTSSHDGDFEVGGVPIHPDLQLRGSFPATHQVSPVALARSAETLRNAAEWADRVYLHADAVYLRHALEGAEIVRSIHDYVYEEALLSTLTLGAAATIVPSDYMKLVVETTVAMTGRKSIEPVIIVPNGIKIPANIFEPRLPSGIAPRQSNDLVLLFPHRPEPTKGVKQAVLTAVEVQHKLPDRNVRLLMPAYPVGSGLDDAAGTTDEISDLVNDLDASDIVELHGWLNPSDMSKYYASGDVTLCIGSFVESFGLVPIESVVNGTPAICAKVGALRQFDGIDGILMVGYGDISAAAEAVLIASQDSVEIIESGRQQVALKYSYSAMIDSYEKLIIGSLNDGRLISNPSTNELTLAPWCDIQDGRIYDDYTAKYSQFDELVKELVGGSNQIMVSKSETNEKLLEEIKSAKNLGILAPKFTFVSPVDHGLSTNDRGLYDIR